MAKDYYELLGVDSKASDSDIRDAYRALAKKYHPDRNPNDADAERKFKEINQAYDVLKDSAKRRAYDMYGAEGMEGGQGGFAGGFDFGGGFADIFESVFDMGEGFGRAQHQRQERARRGSDLSYTMEMDLEDILEGKEVTIKFKSPKICDSCGGSGGGEGGKMVTCSACGGRGVRTMQRGLLSIQTTCSVCSGGGTMFKEKCKTCDGHGRITGEVERDIKVPAGVEAGNRIRLRGQGGAGMQGGESGDLYVVVKEMPHPIFTRDGSSLICRLPISLVSAALGDELETPSIDGNLLRLKIPAGTQSGQRLRVRQKGLPVLNGGRRGDMYVEILVETPTNLSSEQKALLEQFGEIATTRENQPASKRFFEKIRSSFKKS